MKEYRITKIKEYMMQLIDEMTNSKDYLINANSLSKNIGDYSLDKIPTQPEVDNWIISASENRDVFSFRSRRGYSQKVVDNLANIGFFEDLEKKIKSNNDKGVLPEIKGIQSIKCLSCGTFLTNDDGDSSIFDITIEVAYIDFNKEEIISL